MHKVHTCQSYQNCRLGLEGEEQIRVARTKHLTQLQGFEQLICFLSISSLSVLGLDHTRIHLIRLTEIVVDAVELKCLTVKMFNKN